MTSEEFEARRLSLGLTVRGLSEMMGVESSTIERWRKDKRPIPFWAQKMLFYIATFMYLSDLTSAVPVAKGRARLPPPPEPDEGISGQA
jgi:transcriptional regulator with XRE-family HTH domain